MLYILHNFMKFQKELAQNAAIVEILKNLDQKLIKIINN